MTPSDHLEPSRLSATPVITVIMPCYNSSATVLEAIDSVKAQTFSNWELLVIDDGSSDNTPEVVTSVSDARIRMIRQVNGGSASARNKGLEHAKGEYIAFLDSDDSWEPDFLAQMLNALAPEHEAVLAYCGWQNIGLEGGRGKPFIPPDYEPLDRAETFLGGCRWPIHGVLVRRQVIERAGGFDPLLQASEDYDLWLRIVMQGRLVLVPRVLAYYKHHGGVQITKNRVRIALNHLRAQEKFLRHNPEAAARLGQSRVRNLLYGELLRHAYACYWNRDLKSARPLFRKVMRHAYGTPKDWLYMLPALLPESLHAWLLQRRDTPSQ